MGTVSLNMSMHTREPIRDSKLSGPEWIREILYGHSDRVYEAFRMEMHVFLNLCDLMKARGWLVDSRYIRVDEQVGIFLSMISHKNSNRDLCERFQHSGQTISKYFAKVLQAVLNLAREIIVPPSFDVVPEEILINPKYNPYFKDYIGAIDGTHIHASVPVSKQIPFRGRKGITTQNVMCVCSFDMKFTFVYAGWEGSVNDCRVISAALETHRLQFPRPPPGKYYVVDSGYAAAPGFLTPFKGERVSMNAVNKWLIARQSPPGCPPPPGEITPFLHDKGFVLSKLASAQSHQQLDGILKQALSEIEDFGSSHSHHSGNSNEDGCYRILPRIQCGDVAEQEEEDEEAEDLSKP
ncbi:uncharacterized protein LOC115682628 [Syzygium oleosum]|uniref:uncharacterized protein LOC115682628 n=1 Tax=Syzygium oleosum TaxID=219896 RepID=UPI0024B8B53A|nr:uncharacterized protein LOC115682628 [Syzygium oleosum]